MKKIIFVIMALTCCLGFNSCSDDDWDYDHSLENVYFFGPEVWGYDATKKGSNNVVHYEIPQGEIVEIPMQFWCEFIRDYDVTTYYWVNNVVKDQDTQLVRGRDYEIVDANGQPIQPDADGAWSMVWPNAKMGVQNIFIKALGGNKGTFYLQTFNPASSVELSNQNVESTIQSQTKDYTVRIFTQNYRVTINIQ